MENMNKYKSKGKKQSNIVDSDVLSVVLDYKKSKDKPRVSYCTCCNSEISNAPFANMNGAGESTIGFVNLYDDYYILCPQCALAVYNLINERSKQFEAEALTEKREITEASI